MRIESKTLTNSKYAAAGISAATNPAPVAFCKHMNQYSFEIFDVGVFDQVMDDLSMILKGMILTDHAHPDPIHCICPANCIRVQFSRGHFWY